MKIAFIITRSDEIGGAQTHVLALTSRMVTEGHEVYVLVGGDGPLVEYLVEANVKVCVIENLIRNVKINYDVKAYLEIKKALEEIEPDIVTTHSSKAGFLGRLAAKRKKYPVIFTAHGWSFTDGISPLKKAVYKNIERFAAFFTDKIINVSENDRQLALKNRIGKRILHVTVYNGIEDVNEEHEDRRKNNDESIRIIMVARFSPQKDHYTLLRALSQLAEYRWTLDLVGIGPDMEKTKKVARELNIDDKVFFLGERFDIPKLLSNSDIFVLTSNWEGLPISIIEAMRARKAIIASDVGGVKEQLCGDLSWGLVKRKDIQQVRNKLKYLFEHKQKISNLGELSRAEFEKKYSFNNMYASNMKIYKSLL